MSKQTIKLKYKKPKIYKIYPKNIKLCSKCKWAGGISE